MRRQLARKRQQDQERAHKGGDYNNDSEYNSNYIVDGDKNHDYDNEEETIVYHVAENESTDKDKTTSRTSLSGML